MLTNSTNGRECSTTAPQWGFGKTFAMALVGGVIAAALCSIVWVGPNIRRGWHEVEYAAIFGSIFGGWVGFIACVLFGSIRRLREYGSRSMLRMSTTFALLGGIAAFPIFFLFGDGVAMALALAIEGAIFGGLLGVVLGILFFLVMFRRRRGDGDE